MIKIALPCPANINDKARVDQIDDLHLHISTTLDVSFFPGQLRVTETYFLQGNVVHSLSPCHSFKCLPSDLLQFSLVFISEALLVTWTTRAVFPGQLVFLSNQSGLDCLRPLISLSLYLSLGVSPFIHGQSRLRRASRHRRARVQRDVGGVALFEAKARLGFGLALTLFSIDMQ